MADAIHIHPDSCGECASHRPDAAIAALAKRQHGVVARWQLMALGLSRGAVEHRVCEGGWREVEIAGVGNRRGRLGVAVRRANLPSDEITVYDGIPVTTPARTLLDRAAILKPDELERAANVAEVRRLTVPPISTP